MRIFDDVGEVFTDGNIIRWTIPYYAGLTGVRVKRRFSVPSLNRNIVLFNMDTVLRSKMFIFHGESRSVLYMYPKGWKGTAEGWMEIGCQIPSLPSDSAVFFSIVDREGTEVLNRRAEKDGSCYTQRKWIKWTELDSRNDELLPAGHLRIICRVVLPEGREQSWEEPDSESDQSSQNDEVHFEENCDNGNQPQDTEDAEENASDLSPASCSCYICDSCCPINKGIPNLVGNLKDLYLQSKDTDFIIRVRGREFCAHRLILRARIPAFDAMLTHNMTEKNEGVVSLEDCDPDIFNEFLLFVYSGRVENLSPDNVREIYLLSDKYALKDLKEICLIFLKSSLSVESVCEVISLAIVHGETELLKWATDFFVKNAAEIIETVKWQQFLAENPTQGNELFRKTLKRGYTKISYENKGKKRK